LFKGNLEDAGRLREQALEEARRAKDLLKASLFAEGRETQRRADNLNSRAAEMIFRHNNAGRDGDTIDLHGLLQEEALDKTLDFLASKRFGTAKVITGKGLHSAKGESQLKKFMIGYFNSNGIRYRVCYNNSGILEVDFGQKLIGSFSKRR
jgi:DNA-nicking Smr family endonuclease